MLCAVCAALTAICKLISPDLINAVLPRTVELLTHQRELVRKKAVMALHRYLQLDPERDGPLAGIDLDRHLRQALCDKVCVCLTTPASLLASLAAVATKVQITSTKACAHKCVLSQDPSVMSAALCALQEAILRDPKPYKNLIPSFVSILKQVSVILRRGFL